MTTITNKQETFIKTDKNREQILKKYINTCSHCNKVKNEEELDVYIIDVNKEPHTILPLCKSCHIWLLRQEELEHRQERNIIVSKKNEKEYREAKYRFRNNLKNAYNDMNTMIRILHQDNPDWSIKRIIKQIFIENEDIIGIPSERSIYNHLDVQNMALVDPKYHHKSSQQNNIIIDNKNNNDANLHPQVIEESSIYKEIGDVVESQGKEELTEEEKEEKAKNLLPEPIYNYAKEREISPDKKLFLTNSRLQNHPKLQESLINDLVLKTDKEAKNIVAQTIMDLETGALFESGKSYHVHTHLRDRVDQPTVEYTPYKNYFGIMKHSSELLRFLTGHQLAQGEYEYNKDHVNYSAQHRINIVKGLDSGSIVGLMEKFRILRYVMESMESLISEGEEDRFGK